MADVTLDVKDIMVLSVSVVSRPEGNNTAVGPDGGPRSNKDMIR